MSNPSAEHPHTKVAFSTRCCPQWPAAEIVELAKRAQADGVEIELPSLEAAGSNQAFDILTRELDAQSVALAAVTLQISMPRVQEELKNLTDLLNRAADLGAGIFSLVDDALSPENATAAAHWMPQWLNPLADRAAERGITLAIQNSPAWPHGRDLWNLLERVDRPDVGVSWDLLQAMNTGETPTLAIAVLNTRLAHVHVADAKSAAGAGSIQLCPLGEGSIPLQAFMHRLQGIGYQGYVTYAAPSAIDAAHPAIGEMVSSAIAKLKHWLQPPVSHKKTVKHA